MANRYWIGGSGNWSDPSHWSTSSGGTWDTSVPTINDNVYFDANSFDGSGTIRLDISANCKNFDWTGLDSSVWLTSSTNSAYVYGDLTLSSRLITSFSDTAYLYFRGTDASKYITSGGIARETHFNKVFFDGVGSTWINNDSFILGDGGYGSCSIELRNGTWDTNGQDILCLEFTLGSGTKKLKLSGNTEFRFIRFNLYDNDTGLTFDCGQSHLITGEYVGGNIHPTANGNGNIFYDITMSQGHFPSYIGTYYDGDYILTVLNNLRFYSFEYSITTPGLILYHDLSINNTFIVEGHSGTLNSYRRLPIISWHGPGGQHAPIKIYAKDVSAARVDFRDISVGGTANWDLSNIPGWSGDCGGNYGITFTPAVSCYFVHTSGDVNLSDETKWRTSSGGDTSIGRYPLAQDNIIFDNNSFTGSSNITFDIQKFKTIDMSTVSHPVSLTLPADNFLFCYGNFILGENVTSLTHNEYTYVSITGLGNYIINTYDISFGIHYLGRHNSTYTAMSNIVSNLQSEAIVDIFGTFDANDYNITSHFCIDTESAQNIYMGNGIWEITGMHNYGGWVFIAPTTGDIDPEHSTLKLNKTPYNGGYEGLIGIWKDVSFNTIWFSGDKGWNYRIYYSGVNNLNVNNIIIDPGINVKFHDNAVLTVNNSFVALGTPDASITLSSYNAGSQFLLNATNTYIRIKEAYISDASVSPAEDWIAVDSYNLSGNSGITFSDAGYEYTDYYWVGNSGNWTDSSHWAAISGGTPAAYTITSSDNVYFDVNSFSTNSTVTVDVSAKFRTLDMSTAAYPVTLDYTGHDITSYGNFALGENITPLENYDTIVLKGVGNYSFNSFGKSIRMLDVDGAGVFYTNQSHLHIMYSLGLSNEGTFDFNDYDSSIHFFTSTGICYLGNGTLTITGWQGNGFEQQGDVYAEQSTVKYVPIVDSDNEINFTASDWEGGQTYNRVWFTAKSGYYVFDAGTLYGTSNSFKELIIDPGCKIMFKGNITQNVSTFIANGRRDASILLCSDTAGSKFVLNYAGATDVSVTHCYILDSSVTPVTTWYAYNSTDLGNNTGWTFDNYAENSYWVGGSGNWSNASTHWSDESNGIPHAGFLPTIYDNAIFDEYSPLGPEMIYNGTFESSEGWTTGAAWSFNNGVAMYDSSINESRLSQINSNMLFPIENGKNYVISFDIVSAQSEAEIQFYTALGDQVYTSRESYAVGHHNVFFTAPDSAQGIGLFAYHFMWDDAFSIDNYSLREVRDISINMDVSSFGSLNMSTIDQSVWINLSIPTLNAYKIYGDFILSPYTTIVTSTSKIFSFNGLNNSINTYETSLTINGIVFEASSNYTLYSNLTQNNNNISGISVANAILDINNRIITTYDITNLSADNGEWGGSVYLRNGTLNLYNRGYFYRTNLYCDGSSIIRLLGEGPDNYVNIGNIPGVNRKYIDTLWINKGTSNDNYGIACTYGSDPYINTFIIDPGVKVAFEHNFLYNVSTFIAHGTADASILIRSNTPGSIFTINYTGATDVQADYLYVQDSSASPANIWSAGNHGVDLGNNTGWKFRHHRDIRPWMKGNNMYIPFSHDEVWGDNSPAVFTLTSTGDGTGAALFRIMVSNDTTFTVDGSAKFYSDSEGTLDESNTWVAIPGANRTRYIKCTSGTANLYFSNPKNIIGWCGAGATNGFVGGYANDPILSGNITRLINVTGLRSIGGMNVSGNISNLTALQYLDLTNCNYDLTGNISNLTSLKYLYLGGELASSNLTGDITNLTSLEYVYYGDSNTLFGDITNLTSLTHLALWGNNTLTGSVNNLASLTRLAIGGTNTVYGDLGSSGVIQGMTGNLYLVPCNMNTYTSGQAYWPNVNVEINPRVGYGYDSTEVDNILIDMANSHTMANKTITLQGSNAYRTYASNAAVTALEVSGNTVNVNGVTPYAAVYEAFSTKPDASLAIYQNKMMNSLDDASMLDRMDLFYVPATHTNDASEAYFNWLDPTGPFNLKDPSATNPTFEAYKGLTGDDATDWLDTGFIPMQHCANTSTNSFSLGVYINTFNAGGVAIGAISGSPNSRTSLQPTYSTTQQRAYINSDIVVTSGVIPSSSTGLHIGTRIASDRVNVYLNDVCTGTSNVSSSIACQQSLNLLAQHAIGDTHDNFFGSQVAIAFVINGVNNNDVSILKNIFTTYMTEISQIT